MTKGEVIFFTAIIALGIFLRTYHFSDWLHFEIDQSYDTLIVSQAVENGVGNLPLLGPTAGGGRSLRLGPAFYYLEYASAKIFGDTPQGYAILVLIFSLLSLPLFYFFCKRYFSAVIALALLLAWASSLYLVAYSRFSWSPNVLPFLTLAFAYALLRSVDREEQKKERWFLLTAFLLAIVTQIHFNAFFIFPVVTILFLLLTRPRLKLRTWLFAILIFIAAYAPVVISEVKTHGQNLSYFFEKLDNGQGEKFVLGEKITQTFQYTASEYFLALTGIDHINDSNKLSGYGFVGKDAFPWRVGALIILAVVVGILSVSLKREKDQKRKDILLFSSVLFFVSTLYFLSLLRVNHEIYPRFFLTVIILPFIFLGLLLEKLTFKKLGKVSFILPLSLILLLFSINVPVLMNYFLQLQEVDKKPLVVMTEDIFPNTARVTLTQQYAITDYIEARVQENGYPVYLAAKHEYEPIFWYHLEKKGILYHKTLNGQAVYAQGNYFVIAFPGEGIGKHSKEFDITEEKSFGALIVYHLKPKSEAIIAKKQDENQFEIPLEKMQIEELLTWKKIFQK